MSIAKTLSVYYCVRNYRSEQLPTEYYCGGGNWCALDNPLHNPNARLNLRLYVNERLAKSVVETESDAEWFELEISL